MLSQKAGEENLRSVKSEYDYASKKSFADTLNQKHRLGQGQVDRPGQAQKKHS